MRFAIALVALSALSASASSLLRRQSLPSCADPCIENADLGSCSASDDTCLCNSSAFVNSVTSCITSSCTGSDLAEAEQAAVALCAAVGVTLSSPASTSGSSTPSSTAPSSSSSGSASHSSTSSSSASSPTTSTNAAMSHGVNALAGLAAVGAIAFGL
ncbi:hypothetical protein B0H21DRAFT_736774 [Amylocystis lapponica]|nr:hypothetical protein B0H21DRAFT_736774 [Amylocystis lapponica]